MKKILIIQNKFIGDVIYSTIYFEFIKQKYPNAKIHYLICDAARAAVLNHPLLDRVIIYPDSKTNEFLGLVKLIISLRANTYDAVIDVYGKLNSLLVSVLVKSKNTIAYRKWYSQLFYSKTFKRHKNSEYQSSLAIENRLKLLGLLGIDYNPNILPKIFLTDDEINTTKAYLSLSGIDFNRPLLMICIFGSKPSKSYPMAYMVEVIEAVAGMGNYQLLLNYAPSQKADMEQLYDQCTPRTQALIAKKVYGKSLRQLISISHCCSAVIGNDGGPINIAKALGVPSFAIFSPDLNKVNWYGQNEKDKHIAVHLNDYISQERIRKQGHIEEKYNLFKPYLFNNELSNFLSRLAL